MKICHEEAIQQLPTVFDSIYSEKQERALEVACGSGKLTRDFLSKRYQKIDFFDKNPLAVHAAIVNNSKIGT